MTKAEIRAKLDEIIAFSGVERYVDTPVKRYSSGMKVRLAFAVAAHLEPEILIVDEVLAVGDAAFQKKAVGKMQEVSRGEGRTVLFVSHSMGAVKRLCTRGMVLKHGKVHYDGNTDEAVQTYARLNTHYANQAVGQRTDREGLGDYRFTKAWIENEYQQKAAEVRTGAAAYFQVELSPREANVTKKVYAAICFRDVLGARLFTLSTSLFGQQVTLAGKTQLMFAIKRMPLSEGDYLCDLYIAEGRGDTLVQDYVKSALKVTVFGNDYFNSGDPQPRGLDTFYTDFQVIKNHEIPIISTQPNTDDHGTYP